MAANRGIAGLGYEIRVPLVLAVVWSILAKIADPVLSESAVADAIYLSVRVALVAAAGYLTTHQGYFGLWASAVAGALVIFADHLIVKGGMFLLMGELQAAAGVLISYVMFIWVEMIVGFLGGLLGRVRARQRAAI